MQGTRGRGPFKEQTGNQCCKADSQSGTYTSERDPFSRFCIALPVMVPVRPWAAGNRGRKLRLWFAPGFVQLLHIWRSIEWEHGLFY